MDTELLTRVAEQYLLENLPPQDRAPGGIWALLVKRFPGGKGSDSAVAENRFAPRDG